VAEPPTSTRSCFARLQGHSSPACLSRDCPYQLASSCNRLDEQPLGARVPRRSSQGLRLWQHQPSNPRIASRRDGARGSDSPASLAPDATAHWGSGQSLVEFHNAALCCVNVFRREVHRLAREEHVTGGEAEAVGRQAAIPATWQSSPTFCTARVSKSPRPAPRRAGNLHPGAARGLRLAGG